MAGRAPTAPISRCSTRNSLRLPGWQGQAVSPCLHDTDAISPDAEFDLHLNNGRLLEHFHEGNMTYRVQGIREKTPDTFVEVSPELAKERGIRKRDVGAS